MDKYKDLNMFSRSDSLNNFSYWFPKIENCGMLVPKSQIFPVPQQMLTDGVFYMEHAEKDMAAIKAYVENDILPKLQINGLLFVKNGTFSGKFNAEQSCMAMPFDLPDHIARVMYDAMCAEAGGEQEVVIRERIRHDPREIPCIYHGLPFRPEFRVFYDFDSREVIFVANYWDFDYVFPHLYERTDRIIFQAMREEQESAFNAYKDKVAAMVADAMQNVEGLSGPWSIDVMMDKYPVDEDAPVNVPAFLVPTDELIAEIKAERRPKFYLIDMATAERSAYWDIRPGKEKANA